MSRCQHRGWQKSRLWSRADLGSDSGAAAPLLYGLWQVHPPLCTQFARMSKGTVIQPRGVVRTKETRPGQHELGWAQELCSPWAGWPKLKDSEDGFHGQKPTAVQGVLKLMFV